MNTLSNFRAYAGNLSPCQERLARLYFYDKEGFAREVIHGRQPGAGFSYLFDLLREFERKQRREAKKVFNVRTLP